MLWHFIYPQLNDINTISSLIMSFINKINNNGSNTLPCKILRSMLIIVQCTLYGWNIQQNSKYIYYKYNKLTKYAQVKVKHMLFALQNC